MGNRNLLMTVLGVIAAIVIAWFLVDIVLSLAWFVAKLVVVLVVAVIVFFALRGVFGRAERSDGND